MKQPPAQFLSARLAACREIIAGLKLASKKTFGFDRQEIQALIVRITECAAPDNHFIAKDAFNKQTGECYEAIGNLWSCNSKLCPTCIAVQSRRSRKKLREAIEQQKLRKGERYYFVTFTIPNLGLTLVQTRALVDRSWSLFRKRKMFVDLVRGGSKSEEFTLTKRGYHYHLHCIFLSRFILFNELRRLWTECVEIAFNEQGHQLIVETKDRNLFVKVLPVNDMTKAIFEVCKYITKSDSWSKMNPTHLAEVALIRRWHRMFECFGSFSKRTETPVNADDVEASSPILDTRNLSDGVKPSHSELWRDALEAIGLEAYIDRLMDEIVRTRNARLKQLELRWPGSELHYASEFL